MIDFDNFLQNKKRVITLNGKLPTRSNWTTSTQTKEELQEHPGNFGWALDAGDLVVDIDPKNGGTNSFNKLQDMLGGTTLIPTVSTPSGGFHVYLKNWKAYPIKKNNPAFPGIDFLSVGMQCVIPGSVIGDKRYSWVDTELQGFYSTDAPELLLDMLNSTREIAPKEDIGDFEGLVPNNPGWTQDKVNRILGSISPDVDYHTWIKVGMALHQDIGDKKGLAVWEAWSMPGKTYQAGETEKHWRSFTTNKASMVGIASLAYIAKEAMQAIEIKEVSGIVSKIFIASHRELLDEIIPNIIPRKDDIINQSKIQHAVRKRIEELTGVKQPLSAIKELLCPIVGEKDFDATEPSWVENWTYVNSHCAFIKGRGNVPYKKEAFNILNKNKVPIPKKGARPDATEHIKGRCEVVASTQYMPTTHSKFTTDPRSNRALNTFDPQSVPKASVVLSVKGEKVVKMLDDHILMLCSGNQKDAVILTSWLAHQIQKPGVLLGWCPIIYSIPGVGKGFLFELLQSVLGRSNVNKVEATQAISKYTGWASNSSTIILNEIRIIGENRFAIIDRLKPLITDDTIQIEEKFVSAHSAINTANYLCLTNYKDAIPVNKTDRRWWLLHCPIRDITELEELVGRNEGDYFAELFGTLKHFGDIRRWLLDYEIPESFRSLVRAPTNRGREIAIITEEAKTSGLLELRGLIEEGSTFYRDEIVCSANLFADFKYKYSEINLTNREKNHLLVKLDYQSLGQIKIKGNKMVVWAKGIFSNQEVREYFEYTPVV